MFKNIFEEKRIDSHKIFYIFGTPVLRMKYTPKDVGARKVLTNGLDTTSRKHRIIVSLTTFPARINKVHKTIENLLTQTVKPDMLILYLANEEFPNKEADLPEELLRLQDYGLTIKWCEYMRSYQKLIPALMEFPDDLIITFDDDFYYPENAIEDLYVSYLKNPTVIHSHRIWRGNLEGDYLKLSSNRKLFSRTYRKPSYFNFLMGYGGVLYPPKSLSSEVLNVEGFKSLIPTHDDIWFWGMSVLAGVRTVQVDGYDMSMSQVEDTQDVALNKVNKKNSEGVETEEGINRIIKVYPQILEELKKEQNGRK
jgi:hypothetical protein